MTDWTPEQIAAGAEGYVRWLTGEDRPLTKWDRDVATAVLSALDLSDHDRAIAADALRKAADAAADNCASVLNDDDPTEANRWADTEHWLRARAVDIEFNSITDVVDTTDTKEETDD